MKRFIVLSVAIFLGIITLNSCNTKPVEVKSEVWEQGVVTIDGKIEYITQEKDGQTIRLKSNDGETYFVIVSIVNLGENAHQYRQFKINEEIGFQGEVQYIDNQKRLIVRRILEYR